MRHIENPVYAAPPPAPKDGEPKFCSLCQYGAQMRNDELEGMMCRAPENTSLNLVNGRKGETCGLLRASLAPIHCGPSARWYKHIDKLVTSVVY